MMELVSEKKYPVPFVLISIYVAVARIENGIENHLKHYLMDSE